MRPPEENPEILRKIMKNPILPTVAVVALAVFVSIPAAPAAVLITDFGSDEYTPSSSTFTSNVQTTSQITLDGTEGNQIFGDLSIPVDITGFTASLSITGNYTGSYNGQFSIDLYDGDGDSVAYNGFYSNFTTGVSTTVALAFVDQTGTFNPADVRIVGFTAGSSGGSSSVDLVITNLSAVPEPTIWARAGGSLLLLLTRRRRIS